MDIVLTALLSGPEGIVTLNETFVKEMPRLIADAEDHSSDNAAVAALIATDLDAVGAFLHDCFERNERKMNRGAVARMFSKVPQHVPARRVILYCQLAAVCALLRGDRDAIVFYRGKALFAFITYAIHLLDGNMKPMTFEDRTNRGRADVPAIQNRLDDFFDRLTAYA